MSSTCNGLVDINSNSTSNPIVNLPNTTASSPVKFTGLIDVFIKSKDFVDFFDNIW